MAALLLSVCCESATKEDRQYVRMDYSRTYLRMAAGKILNGNGYGMMCDIGLGLLGGVIGGMIFEVLGVRAHNFIGAILMSTSGATALVIATRIIRNEI